MYIEYELMAPDIDDVKKQLIDRGINRWWLWLYRLGELTSLNYGRHGPIVHPSGDIRAWRDMVEWYRQGNSLFVQNSSRQTLPAVI
jgi:hypothetical protein